MFFAQRAANKTIKKATQREDMSVPAHPVYGTDRVGIRNEINACECRIEGETARNGGLLFCGAGTYNTIADIITHQPLAFKYHLLPFILGALILSADFLTKQHYINKKQILEQYLADKGLKK